MKRKIKKIVENAEKAETSVRHQKNNQIEELKKEIALQEKNIVTFEAEISSLEKQLCRTFSANERSCRTRVKQFQDELQ